MKKNNNEVSFGKRFTHFMKYYFGYIVLALLCAIITVVVVGLSV